jgi:hypothetical protein
MGDWLHPVFPDKCQRILGPALARQCIALFLFVSGYAIYSLKQRRCMPGLGQGHSKKRHPHVHKISSGYIQSPSAKPGERFQKSKMILDSISNSEHRKAELRSEHLDIRYFLFKILSFSLPFGHAQVVASRRRFFSQSLITK